jgi:hypothetical protein
MLFKQMLDQQHQCNSVRSFHVPCVVWFGFWRASLAPPCGQKRHNNQEIPCLSSFLAMPAVENTEARFVSKGWQQGFLQPYAGQICLKRLATWSPLPCQLSKILKPDLSPKACNTVFYSHVSARFVSKGW